MRMCRVILQPGAEVAGIALLQMNQLVLEETSGNFGAPTWAMLTVQMQALKAQGTSLQDPLVRQGGRVVDAQDDDQHSCCIYDVLVIRMPQQRLA